MVSPMELLVIRHAIAVDRTEDVADADRPLTDRGRRRFRQVVSGLRALGLRVDQVLASPWLRAAETAELLAPIVLDDGPVRASPHLAAPPGPELIAELASAGVSRLAVVGHEPWLGELVATLTSGEPRHGEAVPLKKGGVAILDGAPAPGGMVLRALLPPWISRQLA